MRLHLLAAAALLAVASAPASALVTTVFAVGDTSASTEQTGADFAGSLSFDDVINRLTITLTNTTPAAVGGYLTGFAFNAPTGADVSLASTSLASFGTFIVGPNTSPFNGFEYGVGVGGNYNGGGSPANGLGVGATATWTFNVSEGPYAAVDFLTPGSGAADTSFVTRFRGLSDGGSDKVPGTEVHTVPVPEPSTYALMLAGLAMVGFMRRQGRGR